MQIQLKQNEITDAITAYIQSQGFNLAGKSVAVDYTAGRKESGIYADIYINEDAPAKVEQEVPAKAKVGSVSRTEGAPTPAADPVPVAEEAPVETSDGAAETPAKTNSLFG